MAWPTIILLFFYTLWIISLLNISGVDGGNVAEKVATTVRDVFRPPKSLPPPPPTYAPPPTWHPPPQSVAIEPHGICASDLPGSATSISEQMADVLFDSEQSVNEPSANELSEVPNDESELTALTAGTSEESENDDFQYAPECESGVYCYGRLLVEVSFAHWPKLWKNTFVNLRMLSDEVTVLKRFDNFLKKRPYASHTTVRRFVYENFDWDVAEKCDLIDHTTNQLPIADRISDARYKQFAISVHNIWNDLAKKVDDDAKHYPDRHSFIYVPNCFIGNFVTSKPFMSYMSNYWITEGLIRSNMLQTYRGILENIFHIVENHGQMLIGNNIYFKGRSHLPMLIKMAKNYQNVAPDGDEFIKRNISTLTAEFKWWYKYRMVEFEKGGKKYKMARYYHQKRAIPRPEAFHNDYHFANIKHGGIRLEKEQRADFYRAVRATTESGYVFSSRFLLHGRRYFGRNVSFLNLDTHNIIPVDLNSVLEFNARQLGQWYRSFGRIREAERYENISTNLQNAIHEVLRNDSRGIWFDYNLITETNSVQFVASNFTPLFTNSFDSSLRKHYGERAVDYLFEEEIILPDGTPRYYCVPVTKLYTGKKWDYPNCFPQTMSIIIEGLRNTGYIFALEIAKKMAAMWIKTNYEGFVKYNRMFGKYNALRLGDEQLFRDERKPVDRPIGYASTNGFLLTLLDYYGEEVSADDYRDFQSPFLFGRPIGMSNENFPFSGE